ncbi:hypothetical protein ZTR_01578 [Talaromyces verruculosus]|nr:hypothetical protein ZTR_01578 [Talaromyces verruculosus]
MSIRARYGNDHGTFGPNDLQFEAKWVSKQEIIYEGQNGYLLTVKLTFLKPFAHDLRFRGAQVNIQLHKTGDVEPSIRKISPEGLAIQVSNTEIYNGQELIVGGGAAAGPTQVNLNVKEMRGKRTTFKGERYIHGISDDKRAFWRLYEERGCRSGLPPIVRLGIVICPRVGCDMEISMSVQRKRCRLWGTDIGFGGETTISAKSTRGGLEVEKSRWKEIWEKRLFPNPDLTGHILSALKDDSSDEIKEAVREAGRYRSCQRLSPKDKEILSILKGLLGFSHWNWKAKNDRTLLETKPRALVDSAETAGKETKKNRKLVEEGVEKEEVRNERTLLETKGALVDSAETAEKETKKNEEPVEEGEKQERPVQERVIPSLQDAIGNLDIPILDYLIPKSSWDEWDLESITGVGGYYNVAQM